MPLTPKTLCIIMDNHWSASRGGAELQARYLEEAARSRGWQVVTVFLRHPNTPAPQGSETAALLRHKVWTRLRDIKYPYAPGLIRRLYQIRPHAIYQRCAMSFTGVAAWYSRRQGCPLFFHIASDRDVRPPSLRGHHPVELPEAALTWYGMRQASTLIAQTRQQAVMLRRHFNREAVVIPNGHPVPACPPKPPAPPLVLWIGNFKPVKQPWIFIRLAQSLKGLPGIRLVMAGRTKGWDSLARKAAAAGIEVLGEVPNHRVNALLETAHLLVNTSDYEGYSNTFIQAWMRRVPVVSLKADPDHVIRDRGLGYCSGTVNRLVSHTRRLLEDPSLREKMGACARSYAAANCSLANFNRMLRLMEND